MAKVCNICGKKSTAGRSMAMKGIAKKKGGIGLHCTGIVKRRFLPNLQKVRARVNNGVKRMLVCTACIQKGLVEKV